MSRGSVPRKNWMPTPSAPPLSNTRDSSSSSLKRVDGKRCFRGRSDELGVLRGRGTSVISSEQRHLSSALNLPSRRLPYYSTNCINDHIENRRKNATGSAKFYYGSTVVGTSEDNRGSDTYFFLPLRPRRGLDHRPRWHLRTCHYPNSTVNFQCSSVRHLLNFWLFATALAVD